MARADEMRNEVATNKAGGPYDRNVHWCAPSHPLPHRTSPAGQITCYPCLASIGCRGMPVKNARPQDYESGRAGGSRGRITAHGPIREAVPDAASSGIGRIIRPCPPRPSGSLVHARNLTKRFGGFTAVDAIDFDVHPARAFGFLGPNGAGKTSTMRMIACSSPVTDGELSVIGMDPRTQARADQGPPGRGAADRQPGPGAHRPREPGDVRALLRHPARRRPPPRRRAPGVRAARGARHRPGRAALRRDEAAAHHRPGAHQRAGPDHPRRADHRPRSAGPPSPLGAALPAQATRAPR